MNDLANLAPLIADRFGIAPSTLVLFLLIVNQVAKVASRLIPNDATGGWAVLGKLCAILGADVSSRITTGVRAKDVLEKTLTQPVVAQQVADKLGKSLGEVLPGKTS